MFTGAASAPASRSHGGVKGNADGHGGDEEAADDHDFEELCMLLDGLDMDVHIRDWATRIAGLVVSLRHARELPKDISGARSTRWAPKRWPCKYSNWSPDPWSDPVPPTLDLAHRSR